MEDWGFIGQTTTYTCSFSFLISLLIVICNLKMLYLDSKTHIVPKHKIC
jgi:hypothetical protein